MLTVFILLFLKEYMGELDLNGEPEILKRIID